MNGASKGKRFVVIGGGISGLAAAHRLAELSRAQPDPCRVTLLEASPRFGGLIETQQEGQFLLESGPDAFLCEKPWVTDLCRRIGIQEEMIRTNEKFRRSFVLCGGELTLKAGPSQWPEMERWYAGGSRYSRMLSFKRGVEQLIQTLSRKMPEAELRLSSPVARIEKGTGLAVILQNGETLQADAVCVAIPAGKAATLIQSFAPELAGQLNAIPHESVATLNAVFRRSDVAHPLDAFGFVVPSLERRRILGATFSSVKFPGRATQETVLIRAFVGGASHRELVELADSAMKQMVVEELRQILGIRGEPILTVIRRYPQAMPQYKPDHCEKVAAIEEQAARYPGLYVIGNAYHGVGIPDCIHQAETAAERMFGKPAVILTLNEVKGKNLDFFDHILLIGFGGPTRPEEVKPFLEEVTRGLRIPEARLEEVAHHYELTGGSSPYNAHTFHLMEKLKPSLMVAGVTLPVFIGMRNWHPFLKETMQEIKQLGLKKGIGIILAPHRSPASFEKYVANVEGAKQHAVAQEIRYEYLKPWHDHPFFIQAQADHVRAVLESFSLDQPNAAQLLFSAHSIPLEMAQDCRYEQEFKESSALVAQALHHSAWSIAYQSRSGSPRQSWLEPDVPAALRRLKSEGKHHVVLVPVGFLFDHTEVLYDLDIEARLEAEKIGLEYSRASTVMDHPKFVSMFTRLIQEQMSSSRKRGSVLDKRFRG